jgi:hypothetical protein
LSLSPASHEEAIRIAQGGLLPPLPAEVKTRQTRREEVMTAITHAQTVVVRDGVEANVTLWQVRAC